MNKLGHILPLALFFAVAGGEASATIKFDVSHTANKVNGPSRHKRHLKNLPPFRR